IRQATASRRNRARSGCGCSTDASGMRWRSRRVGRIMTRRSWSERLPWSLAERFIGTVRESRFAQLLYPLFLLLSRKPLKSPQAVSDTLQRLSTRSHRSRVKMGEIGQGSGADQEGECRMGHRLTWRGLALGQRTWMLIGGALLALAGVSGFQS